MTDINEKNNNIAPEIVDIDAAADEFENGETLEDADAVLAESVGDEDKKQEKTESNIKVSVIIPIYNAHDFLRPAMDSILSQTLTEIELICIDDGSTDHSLEIVKEYQKSDERVRIIAENNAGPAHARNNGMKRARGEYLLFFDADDFCEPDFLEVLYTEAKANDLDIVIAGNDLYNNRRKRFEEAVEGDDSTIFDDGAITSKNEHPDIILTSVIGSAWDKLFRRSFVVSKGLSFLVDVKMYEDVYFTVCAMSLAERVKRIDKVLVHHRIHSDQTRAKNFGKYYTQVPIVYKKIKEFLVSCGMYIPLKSSYINLSASRCYKIFNLLSRGAREDFYDVLHNEYSILLGWHDAAYSDFRSDEVYSFASDVILYTYNQYKKKVERDEDLRREKEREEERARRRTERLEERIQKINEKYENKLENIRKKKEKKLAKLVNKSL